MLILFCTYHFSANVNVHWNFTFLWVWAKFFMGTAQKFMGLKNYYFARVTMKLSVFRNFANFSENPWLLKYPILIFKEHFFFWQSCKVTLFDIYEDDYECRLLFNFIECRLTCRFYRPLILYEINFFFFKNSKF